MTRVLVIEDSRTQAARLRLLLQGAGYEVRIAEDGPRGLDACRQWNPHVVLCDVLMPGMNGYQVTRAIKQEPDLAGVQVALMTGLDSVDNLVQAMQAGADNYVAKPYVEERLLQRIERMVDPERARALGDQLVASVGEVVRSRSEWVEMFVSCLEDVVERNRALLAKQEELTRTNAQREELMRVVAHELRGPLQALAMRAAVAQSGSPINSRLDDLPVAIDKQVKAMVRIIDDLSDLTALDLGNLELAPVDTVLETPVRSAIQDTMIQHPDRELRVELPEGLLCRIDPMRIQQVVVNFLTNAIKYSPDGSPIEVSARRDGSSIHLEIHDQGAGIPPELCERVFDRYFRVQQTRHEAKGVGLGLYICRRIIELHGGQIGVRSSPGQGSVFWFSLPAAA